MENSEPPAVSRPQGQPSIIARLRRWLKRALVTLLLIISFYLFAAVVGAIPVNTGFENSAEGIDVLITSNGFHSDLWLPIVNQVFDWRTFLSRDSWGPGELSATHVAIGWGDTAFYLETPTWKDLKLSTAVQALFVPTSTVMHVDLHSLRSVQANVRWIRLSPAQYSDLVAFVTAQFAVGTDGSLLPITGSYGTSDAFFMANGKYHCFNTCNCWTGAALRAAGVKTGWFTPFPGAPTLYLESAKDHDEARLTSTPEVLFQ